VQHNKGRRRIPVGALAAFGLIGYSKKIKSRIFQAKNGIFR
jgi:hypothetical protein